MTRKFKTADYDKTLDLQISLREALPPEHLVYFIVDVISQLDLRALYGRYAKLGAPPYAPEIMLGLLFYGYATGVFSSRKIERATYEVIPFRFIAGDMHPDHATIAAFRKQFLPELKELFVQILLIAQAMRYLQVGNVSVDGSKIHADASKSKAVSYKRLLAIEAFLQGEVEDCLLWPKPRMVVELPEDMNVDDEIERRQQRLSRLAEAKQVLADRARIRYEAEQAEYEAKLREREEKAAKKGQKPRGRKPKPPTPGPRDKDQYNFTDPDSQIMKNSTNSGFDQHYNVQVVVEHDSRLIVGNWLCNQTNDKQAALPTIDSVPAEIGKPETANLDTGYFSQDNIEGFEAETLTPTSLRGARRIIRVGALSLLMNLRRQPRMLPPKRKWPTSSVPTSVMPSIACANPPWNRSLASSRRCWASASFLFGTWTTLLASGPWSVWPTISNACIPCILPKPCFNASPYQKGDAISMRSEPIIRRYVYD